MTSKSIRLMPGIGLLLLSSVCGGGTPTTPCPKEYRSGRDDALFGVPKSRR